MTNKWINYNYNLPNNLLSMDIIEDAINKFIEVELKNISNNKYFFIMFKIKTSDNIIRNISSVQRIKKGELPDLIEIFQEYWNLKSDNYQQFQIETIIFNYRLIEDSFEISSSKLNKVKKIKTSSLLNYGGVKLPQTMDIFQWGNVEFINNESEAIVYKYNSNSHYYITFNKHKMIVSYVLNQKTLFTSLKFV